MIYLCALMSFIYPGFLFALLALSIPIIVHLFNFKRFKKVYFSDVRFLKDIELQTRQRNQLKHLLVLLTRLLAITFLVMAFAQPVIPTGSDNFNPQDRTVSVYLDNSFSMDGEGEDGDLLENGKLLASQIGDVFAKTGEVKFFTNQMNAAQGRSLAQSEFNEAVSRTVLSSTVRPLSQVVKRVADRDEANDAADIYAITDLQKVTLDLENIEVDSNTQINLIPVVANSENNLFIDSLWFTSPIRQSELPDNLNVRIRNEGAQRKTDIPVRLIINGTQRALANVSVEPNSFEIVPLRFRTTKAGYHFGEVQISDHPITYDDNYFFAYRLASQINVLEIRSEQAPRVFSNLFSKDPDFKFDQMDASRIDHSAFSNYDLIILNELEKVNSGLIQELVAVLGKGSSVLMAPSMEVDHQIYNELLLASAGIQFTDMDTSSQKVSRLNLSSDIFKNVFMEWKGRIDLPSTNRHFRAAIPSRNNSEVLMQLEGGDALLVRSENVNGAMYVFTTSASENASQLASHAIVVPTLYNIALNSQTGIEPYHILGRNDKIELVAQVGNEDVLEFRSLDSDLTVIPEIRRSSAGIELNLYDQLTEAGHFVVMNGADTIQATGFNYDRKESRVAAYTQEQLEQKILDLGLGNLRIIDGTGPDLGSTIKEMHEGKKLWKLFLVLALICLAIEVLLLRIL